MPKNFQNVCLDQKMWSEIKKIESGSKLTRIHTGFFGLSEQSEPTTFLKQNLDS